MQTGREEEVGGARRREPTRRNKGGETGDEDERDADPGRTGRGDATCRRTSQCTARKRRRHAGAREGPARARRLTIPKPCDEDDEAGRGMTNGAWTGARGRSAVGRKSRADAGFQERARTAGTSGRRVCGRGTRVWPGGRKDGRKRCAGSTAGGGARRSLERQGMRGSRAVLVSGCQRDELGGPRKVSAGRHEDNCIQLWGGNCIQLSRRVQAGRG